ncbi:MULTISPECIES: transcription termination/antitermination protein NusG [Agrobacterium]|uniref:transcription termination/antitermination protein NusG n=1 Tax=Agrobacterium TaxID=357 RepID=UPI00277E3100|nr:transcription termination/antitermination NusG family protein [Agrobacterium sp. SORGH_AS_0745]MDP9758308.1 transcriptional antiterminator NusG [Agrobacterium tumefaciens]MDQ1219546.1 transcriptional antiterminator NusG [Agrobacterium sp. SORGH_AS_0745]
MMQHRFKDICGYVSPKGFAKLDRIAQEAARVAEERFSASKERAHGVSDSAWVIARVEYGREKAVENAMIEVGIEACVIMRLGPERKRHGRRLPASRLPVFNGIVFVYCLPDNHALRGILSFDGVKNIVMSDEKAVKISVETINQFKELAEDGAYDYVRRSDAIRKGDKVRITSGPFIGFEVAVEAFGEDGYGDAVVTIVIFGKPTVFNMPLAMLEKV